MRGKQNADDQPGGTGPEQGRTANEAAAGQATVPPGRITPQDIQQKEFRLAFRGYNERDVDQFLDELTDEVARLQAENRRLRDEFAARGTMPISSAGAIEADAVLRQARDQAARIIGEAEERASAVGASSAAVAATGAVSPGQSGLGSADQARAVL